MNGKEANTVVAEVTKSVMVGVLIIQSFGISLQISSDRAASLCSTSEGNKCCRITVCSFLDSNTDSDTSWFSRRNFKRKNRGKTGLQADG